MTNHIKRVYVIRFSDTGQITANVEWRDGSRTTGSLHYSAHPHRKIIPHFGMHMHALFARARRAGLRMERETW